MKDERFAKVFEGTDDNFGIERTASEFKETDSMKDILLEQRRSRKKGGELIVKNDQSLADTDDGNNHEDDNVKSTSLLVSKLKRKFQ